MKKGKNSIASNSASDHFVFRTAERTDEIQESSLGMITKSRKSICLEDELGFDDEYYYGRYDIQESFFDAEEEFND
jgi:hypothetical protein